MSEIAKNTRADLFRKRIEDKNTLTGAGAIYVGTGKKTEIEGAGVAGTIGVYYETVGVTPTAVGQVPISVSGTDTAEVAGIEFKSATGIFDGTPTPIRMIATGKGTDGNVRIVSMNNDVMISASHDMTIGVGGDTGTTHLTGKLRLENRENQDITKRPYVEVDSKSVVIKDLASKTSFKPDLVQTTGGTTAPFRLLYQIPEGTWGLDASGAPYQFQSTEPENYLPSIIYNIGQRLDSLGFKEGTVYDPSGTVSILKLTKIGYYVLATLLQSITLDNGVTSYWFETGAIPEDFRRLSEKPDAKELFVLKTDYMITTGGEQHSTNNRNFAIEYMGEHTFQFNADYISSTGVSYIRGIFNKGTTFGYDIRE